MTASAEKLLQRVLDLDETDRASIAGALIESLHAADSAHPEAAIKVEKMDAVIARRVGELESGAVQTLSESKARERLFRGFEHETHRLS